MKKKILILDEEQHHIDEILKNMEIEISDIEVIEASLEDVKIVKNILNKDKEPIDRIREILNVLGVPNDKIGYKYIIDAILLCNEYQNINNLKIYYIYEKIALKYNKSISSVEKAIRKCIEYCFQYGNLKELEKIFFNVISIKTWKINSKKFISKIVQYLNKEKIL